MTSSYYDYQTFGKCLSRVLKQSNMSCSDLAKLMDKKASYVANLLEPDANPTIKTVGLIANSLEIPVEKLVCSQKDYASTDDCPPDELLTLFAGLDEESRALVLDFIQLLK